MIALDQSLLEGRPQALDHVQPHHGHRHDKGDKNLPVLFYQVGELLSLIGAEAVPEVAGHDVGTAGDELAQADESSRLRLDVLYGKTSVNGSSGDLSWETRTKDQPVLGNQWKIRYRTLSVKSEHRSIELIIP